MHHLIRLTPLLAFVFCIPAANWMIANVGTICPEPGLCLIPVAPGLMAPSGVSMIGLSLVLRDIVQRQHGFVGALLAILGGTVLASWCAPAHQVLASGTAFLISELADLAVYTPLARRRFLLAVVASSIVGLIADSLVFLYLAFGSLDHLLGQVVGKGWMVLLSVPIIARLRKLL